MNTYIVIAVMVIFVILMLSGKVPFALAGMTCVLALVLSGAVSLVDGFSGFADKNVVMLAGMFVIAELLGRTSFIERLKKKMLSAKGGSDLKVAFMLLAFSAVLAQVIPSQTSIIMIMMSFLMGLGSNGEVTMARMLLPITFVLTSWLGKVPVSGMGLTTYMMFNQMLEGAGASDMLNLFSMAECTLVPSIITLIYCLMTYKMLPKNSAAEIDLSKYTARDSKTKEETAMSPKEEKIIYAAFIISIVGLVLTNFMGDAAFAVPLAVVVVLIFMKVIPGQQVLISIFLRGPVIICASILGLSNAMSKSGAGELIGKGILHMLGGNPSPILVLLVFAIIALLLTSFCSNTACFMVLVPIACTVCVTAGFDPRAVVITIFNCSLMSVITPMASGGAALAYSTCNLTIRETWKWTIPLALIGTAATMINCYMVYPMI